MRAAAALAVFYYHISSTVSSTFGADRIAVDYIGAAGVDLFFVISGFIMAHIAWERPTKPSDFLLQRIIRIAPLYWTATLVVFALAWFAPNLLGSTKADVGHLLHSLLFLPNGSNYDTAAPLLLVGWTLNYEMFFYVLVAIFAGVFKDRSLLWLSLALLVFVLGCQFVELKNPYLEFYCSPIVLEFAMGILVFHLWRRTPAQSYNLLFYIGFAISVTLLVLQFENQPGDMRILKWGIPAALLLLCGLHVIKFKSEALRRLGDWSYAMYIIHLFVILGFVRVMIPIIPGDGLAWQLAYIFMTVVLIIGSALVYYLFEMPIKNYLRKIFPPYKGVFDSKNET